jgi:hypothetical protein
MFIEYVFGRSVARLFTAISRQLAQLWCGVHGHIIMLHFEPDRLSLQCSLCGYESEGWKVGRPVAARRNVEGALVAPEVRRHLQPLPSDARLAS